jgi:TonB family protein
MSAFLGNVGAYAVQLAALVAVAWLAVTALRVRRPFYALRFWQCTLAMALLLPLAQPWREATIAAPIWGATTMVFETPREAFAARTGVDALSIAAAILALGILARLGWLLAGLLRARSLIANARRDEALDAVMIELKAALGTSATLMVSNELTGPATVGAKQPVVLVPPSTLTMSPAVQRAILCHELIHVRRRDWLNTIAEEVWCAVLWFHPLARVLASRLSLARETVVDEQTILITRDRRAYAEALLAFSNPQPHVIGVTPFIGRRTLSQRISLIAEEVPMSRRRALLAAVIALTTTIGTSAAVVDRFPMTSRAQGAEVIYEPGNGVTLPVVVREVKPSYTRAAMQAKIQGSVWLATVVGATGDVTNVQVTRSLDAEHGLDQEAIKAAYQWKFKPAQKDGKPVAVRVTIELTFTLKK